MISKEHKEILEQLGKSHFANRFVEFLETELSIVNDVSSHSSWDEVLERRGKAKFIKELIRHMEEKETPDKKKNSYT